MGGGNRSYRGEQEKLPEARDKIRRPQPSPKASAPQQKCNLIPSVSAAPHGPKPLCWL